MENVVDLLNVKDGEDYRMCYSGIYLYELVGKKAEIILEWVVTG